MVKGVKGIAVWAEVNGVAGTVVPIGAVTPSEDPETVAVSLAGVDKLPKEGVKAVEVGKKPVNVVCPAIPAVVDDVVVAGLPKLNKEFVSVLVAGVIELENRLVVPGWVVVVEANENEGLAGVILVVVAGVLKEKRDPVTGAPVIDVFVLPLV